MCVHWGKGKETRMHLYHLKIYILICFSCEAVDEIKSVESLQFEFSTIRAATDNSSDANKLGKGGFGAVYRVGSHFDIIK